MCVDMFSAKELIVADRKDYEIIKNPILQLSVVSAACLQAIIYGVYKFSRFLVVSKSCFNVFHISKGISC